MNTWRESRRKGHSGEELRELAVRLIDGETWGRHASS